MYYLLLHKFIREGGSTTADMATHFEPTPPPAAVAEEMVPKPPSRQRKQDLNRTMPAEMHDTHPRFRRFIDYTRRNESVDHTNTREAKSQSRACTREYIEYARRNDTRDQQREQSKSVSRAPTRENVILTKYKPREMPSRVSTQSTSPTPRIQNRRIIINAPVAKPNALISPLRTRKVATRAGHRMMTPAGRQPQGGIYIGNGTESIRLGPKLGDVSHVKQ